MTMDANEIANGFNQQNDKKLWSARAFNRTGAAAVVHFTAKSGMISLEYDTELQRFAVKFNKYQGAWGDYIKAISRSLFVVLNTLKSAGLAFEAPFSQAGMVVEIVTSDEGVFCAWRPDHPRAATMPELRDDPAPVEPLSYPEKLRSDLRTLMGLGKRGDDESLPPIL